MQTQLQKRILTSLILIPIVVLAVLFSPPIIFACFTGIFILLAAYEWTGLSGLSTFKNKLWGLAFMALMTSAIWAVLPVLFTSTGFNLLSLLITFWLIATVFILIYPAGTNLLAKSWLGLIMGIIVLIFPWFLILVVQQSMPYLLLYLFVLVWSVDIGAYFAGKRFGTHKLAPTISPGKTWQGVVGGIGLALIITIAGYLLGYYLSTQGYFNLITIPSLGRWVMASIAAIIFSIIGDLFESLLKRIHNLKDSGSIIPGHGGILDRIDSLLAAVPFFLAFI